MQKPNQKLQDALETFYKAKIAEFKQNYHLNQNCSFCVYPSTWDKTIELRYDCRLDTWTLYSHDKFDLWVGYDGFFERYADIKKHLDALQKKETSLFRFAEKQNNVQEQQPFSM